MGEGRGEVALIALAAEAFSGRAQINQSTNPAIWRLLPPVRRHKFPVSR